MVVASDSWIGVEVITGPYFALPLAALLQPPRRLECVAGEKPAFAQRCVSAQETCFFEQARQRIFLLKIKVK
jgi:hypothetical protein